MEVVSLLVVGVVSLVLVGVVSVGEVVSPLVVGVVSVVVGIFVGAAVATVLVT